MNAPTPVLEALVSEVVHHIGGGIVRDTASRLCIITAAVVIAIYPCCPIRQFAIAVEDIVPFYSNSGKNGLEPWPSAAPTPDCLGPRYHNVSRVKWQF